MGKCFKTSFLHIRLRMHLALAKDIPGDAVVTGFDVELCARLEGEASTGVLVEGELVAVVEGLGTRQHMSNPYYVALLYYCL